MLLLPEGNRVRIEEEKVFGKIRESDIEFFSVAKQQSSGNGKRKEETWTIQKSKGKGLRRRAGGHGRNLYGREKERTQ